MAGLNHFVTGSTPNTHQNNKNKNSIVERSVQIFIASILIFLLSILSCSAQPDHPDLLNGEFWKSQGLETVMSAWIENGIDSTDGQFRAFMDRQWNPYDRNLKYPGMLSRHLFSYSAAYMMSGEPHYLNKADKLFEYLINHGWDEDYGGWHYAINPKGKAVDSKKDLFMNIYAVTGLAMYYMVTHDQEAMEYIRETRSLLKEHAWDDENGGYYRRLDRTWKVTNDNKVFTPQVAPVSGYLLYLYAATQDQDYLEETKQLMSLVSKHMQDQKLGWIREKFDPEWNPLTDNKKEEKIDIGHNIEVVWIWLRLYAITGDPSYKKKAENLYDNLHNHAFRENGAWFHKMALTNPNKYSKTTNWWIQAYGNMLELPMYHYGHNDKSLEYFKSGASFWNTAFVDEQYGGTTLSANLNGSINRGDKAVRTKTSYHAVEHSLLNYLYLNLWVQEQPVTLYFHWDTDSDDAPLCPLPVTDLNTQVTEVSINGNSQIISDPNDTCIAIPDKSKGSIKITIE